MLFRLRASAIAIFCASVCFALAYGFLQKLADPQAPFDAVAAAHGEVATAFTVVVVGFIVALLAILAGGAPIGCVMVARHRHTTARYPVAVRRPAPRPACAHRLDPARRE